MKPLFAAAVAAPWGSSKGLITSKAYTHLAHAVISPRSTRKNCSLIVLGVGDAPVPGSLQANVADGIGNTTKEWTKHATFLPKKAASYVLASAVLAFPAGSQLSCHKLAAFWCHCGTKKRLGGESH